MLLLKFCQDGSVSCGRGMAGGDSSKGVTMVEFHVFLGSLASLKFCQDVHMAGGHACGFQLGIEPQRPRNVSFWVESHLLHSRISANTETAMLSMGRWARVRIPARGEPQRPRKCFATDLSVDTNRNSCHCSHRGRPRLTPIPRAPHRSWLLIEFGPS